ncbi:DUF397 domain-containing protein [Streptomyces sp. NPDC059142]|uniref:DUF397 domain-containing protein n=1 Tax=unclassified Streptomyces TaxID=2593676 RepID=UPI0036856C77
MNTALEWFKSSYSTEQGGDCLEVAYDWRKSSYSGDEGGNCLEVAHERSEHSPGGDTSAIRVRDSKNPTGPVLTLAPAAWAAFTSYAAD